MKEAAGNITAEHLVFNSCYHQNHPPRFRRINSRNTNINLDLTFDRLKYYFGILDEEFEDRALKIIRRHSERIIQYMWIGEYLHTNNPTPLSALLKR